MARMMTMDEACRVGLASLELLLIGGEAFPVDLAHELRNVTKAEIINMYGPTETTVWSSTYSLPSGELITLENGPVISVGRPVANTTFYVLDRHLQSVPPGVAGELFIGGAGIARGYLNLPSLTAERFLANPFDHDHDSRLYRTGDLVRHGKDGCLQFLGRIDDQVKIRGYRIEPGEIEQRMQGYPGINQAVIVTYEFAPGDKRLRACVVPSPGAQVSVPELRQHLKGLLPEYMIPGEFVFMGGLPLTPNKKLDRKALAALCPSISVPEERTTPSLDGMEAVVARVWEKVLGSRNPGKDANFFDLGGNSFLAMKAHYRLRQVTGREISLTDIFQYPTVRLLAEFLGQESASDQIVQKGAERGRARRGALTRARRIEYL
jgi:acyl-coenzyme A synthetase/AMP-(fatty) acid ligase